MKGPGHQVRHASAMLAIAALLAAHGVILQFIAAHTPLSLAAVLALGGLIAIKHLGLLRPTHVALRRYFHRNR